LAPAKLRICRRQRIRDETQSEATKPDVDETDDA